MKLLLDQNLSHQLCFELGDLFPVIKHVKEFSLDKATDQEILEFAKQNNYIIVTKDSDFNDKIREVEPKVIWIRKGNCTTESIKILLRNNFSNIESFSKDTQNSILIF